MKRLHWTQAATTVYTLSHNVRQQRRLVFASPVGGEEAKLRNGQLCIFHCSGSLARTGIRRREVGRWGDSEDGAGRRKARGAELRGGGGGVGREYFQKSIKRQEKSVVSCFQLHWRACGFVIFESMKSLPSRGGGTLMPDLMMFFFIHYYHYYVSPNKGRRRG